MHKTAEIMKEPLCFTGAVAVSVQHVYSRHLARFEARDSSEVAATSSQMIYLPQIIVVKTCPTTIQKRIQNPEYRYTP